MALEKPWLRYYGDVPATLDYPRVTMIEALMRTVARHPDEVAFAQLVQEEIEKLVEECGS